jgi:hypothetical protein
VRYRPDRAGQNARCPRCKQLFPLPETPQKVLAAHQLGEDRRVYVGQVIRPRAPQQHGVRR